MIASIFTIKNSIKNGYPFIEAILSSLPIVDECLINDGGSEDGTLECLEHLKEVFPKTVKLFNIPDYDSEKWQVIDDQLEYLISKAKGEWLLEVQGDELFCERDIINLGTLILSLEKYNSIRQPRWDTHWNTLSCNKDYPVVRIVRNLQNLKSYWGGDDFRIGPLTSLKNNQTSHDVPPEFSSDIPIIHLHNIFPKHNYNQSINHLYHLGINAKDRKDSYDSQKEHFNTWNNLPNKKRDHIFIDDSNIPSIIKDMQWYNKYFVRPELFDKTWLTKTTGLNYFFD